MNAYFQPSAMARLFTNHTVLDRCLAEHLHTSELDSLHCGEKHFAKGSYLLRQGDVVPYLYSIKSGCAKGYTNTILAVETIRQFHYVGDMIGLDAFVGSESPVNIVALQNCEVSAFPLPALKAAIRRSPKAQDFIIQSFASMATQAFELSMGASAEKRLAAFLINFSERQSTQGLSATSYVLPMSRLELANYLRLAHETVSRVLTSLRHKQLVDVSARSVTILDFEELTALAGGARL